MGSWFLAPAGGKRKTGGSKDRPILMFFAIALIVRNDVYSTSLASKIAGCSRVNPQFTVELQANNN